MAHRCHRRGQSPNSFQQLTRRSETEHARFRPAHMLRIEKRSARALGAAGMSTWTQNGTAAARRRMAAMQCAVGTPASGVTMRGLLPRASGAFGEVRRKRLCAMALAVLAAHGLVVVEVQRVMMSDPAVTKPRVLDVEFSMQDAIPLSPGVAQQPAAHPQQNAARPESLKPRTPSPARGPSDANAHRSVSEPRRTLPSAAATRAKPPSQTPAPALAQPSTGAAVAPTPGSSTVEPQSLPPVAEPLTEPGFGAAYLHNPAPAYPAVALERGWQGTVLLKVHVLANGRADHVALVSTSGHQPLDDAAAQAVTDWSFVPARRGAQAVDGWVQVPIDFKLGT
jgi:protein TonB